MDIAKQQLHSILDKCQQERIAIGKLTYVDEFLRKEVYAHRRTRFGKVLKGLLAIIVLIIMLKFYHDDLQTQRCLLVLPNALRYAFRPPERCEFCENTYEIQRVRDITSAEFAARFAYSGKPVIVEDATANWTAVTRFNYWYFRDVYQNARRKDKLLDCQFLPYKTGFRNLLQALDMPRERVELQPGTQPWYFGWSNCNPETAEELRRHYDRPYFLPETSENNAVDWFFIGTSGLGAHMHIDNVRLPSWQAQLSGSKRWVLAPPPECYFQCRQLSEVVRQGDMIVLDTNKWYHQTFVEPGKVSLTVGAEYD